MLAVIVASLMTATAAMVAVTNVVVVSAVAVAKVSAVPIVAPAKTTPVVKEGVATHLLPLYDLVASMND